VRLQTFCIVVNNGSKIRKPEQLWSLNSDRTTKGIADMVVGSPEHIEWYKKIKEKYKLK
jgi:hypothetical protein